MNLKVEPSFLSRNQSVGLRSTIQTPTIWCRALVSTNSNDKNSYMNGGRSELESYASRQKWILKVRKISNQKL